MYREALPQSRDIWEPIAVAEANKFLLTVPIKKILYFSDEVWEASPIHIDLNSKNGDGDDEWMCSFYTLLMRTNRNYAIVKHQEILQPTTMNIQRLIKFFLN